MTTETHPQLHSGIAACPACIAAPSAGDIAARARPISARIALSVPGVHCGACISTLERGLAQVPGVTAARVNLTLKRAMIDAAPHVGPDDLIAAARGLGYEAFELDAGTLSATTQDRAGRDLLMRLAVAGFASMNVMLLSVAVWSGADGATRDLFHWISAAIAFPAIAFAGQPFLANAALAWRTRRLNMDVPIVMAIVLALANSLSETIQSGHHAYFDAALTLVFFLLAGRYLDHRTRAIARSAAQELAALEVPRALRITDGVEASVSVSDLRVGDLILVRPGGRMPVDGEIVTGTSEIDRSLLTGESRPVFAAPGQVVSAGEVNLTGPLTLRALAVGQDTSLHRLADLVAIAESGRSRYTSMADMAARLYAPMVHLFALVAFVGWYVATADIRLSLNIAAAVLIITCPCALALAVPAVTTAASGRLFKRGLLIKDATALERLAQVDTVVFDKTGTLTAGVPEVGDLSHLSPRDQGLAMALAGASSHPLSVALRQALAGQGVPPANVTDIHEVPGYGTEAQWQGRRIRLGRAQWVGADPTAVTAAWLAVGGDAPSQITFTDRLRPGATDAVAALRASGRQVILMSGDSTGAVAALAARLGIADWLAEALPGDKAARIKALQDQGQRVLMVGDGLNDTAALSVAHASISPASALDAARVASDIVLLGTDLSPIAEAIHTAEMATRRIRQNFRLAKMYNLVAVPLAVAGFCSPLIAALAMSSSSIIVSLNALRLR